MLNLFLQTNLDSYKQNDGFSVNPVHFETEIKKIKIKTI